MISCILDTYDYNAYDLYLNKQHLENEFSQKHSLKRLSYTVFFCFRDKAKHYYFGDNTRVQILNCS